MVRQIDWPLLQKRFAFKNDKNDNIESTPSMCKLKETRMTTFIKAKFNRSDDQTNIEIQRSRNITEYQN